MSETQIEELLKTMVDLKMVNPINHRTEKWDELMAKFNSSDIKNKDELFSTVQSIWNSRSLRIQFHDYFEVLAPRVSI